MTGTIAPQGAAGKVVAMSEPWVKPATTTEIDELLDQAVELWLIENFDIAVWPREYQTTGNRFLGTAEDAYFRIAREWEAWLEAIEEDKRAGMKVPAKRGFWTYRFFDEHGRLLYVGSTVNPRGRAAAHRRGDYWQFVARMQWDEHVDTATMLRAEREAILDEHPTLNSVIAPLAPPPEGTT